MNRQFHNLQRETLEEDLRLLEAQFVAVKVDARGEIAADRKLLLERRAQQLLEEMERKWAQLDALGAGIVTAPAAEGQDEAHVQLREPAVHSHSVLNETSPFIAGAPITHPRHFFGQGRVVKRLFNLLKRHPLQNTAIIGPRRSGKTSLLLYLKNLTTTAVTAPDQLRADQRTSLLPQPEQYRWAFVSFQYSWLGERENLLHYILSELGFDIPSPCDMKGFMDVMRRCLQTPTVILLDEVDVALQRYPALDDAFWDDLRNLATYQVAGNLSFVLASCEPLKQMARRSGAGSPFFNIFAFTETLGPLTEPEACALIASSPMPFANDDVEWILTKSGRWPILLQILCSERLFALEEEVSDDDWRERGLRQIEAYDHLLKG